MTDLSQFLQTFYEESFEGLEIMETGLLNLDIGAADAEEINTIFRAAHSIKGGSATFGLGDVAEFTHLMETLDELTHNQICELIFHPGLSTAEVVSDVSGRGVGMDVVRRNIHSLGGGVEITSELGVGSCITVRLPLTLAILDGQTVAVGKEHYIVPLVSIIESIQIKPGTVRSVGGRGETFELRGEYLPIIRLSDVFSVETKVRELTEGLLVVVEGDGKQVGLFVDDLLGQQQVVIKSLEANYKKVDGLSGATILGSEAKAVSPR
ncbi:chemotaxis protein CheA [Solemya pervernicosa gill symbiont]|uniref:chemotaxis protein CheA n=1 Tax=Solemya pervernicosa gill symbiont TaxID=642797 RepID=UPI00099793BC|nr:chemotaxis protein CheW [Solemya pervernicosa gill symbiont]